MSAPPVRSVGGECPWEIGRSYPYVSFTPVGGTEFEYEIVVDAPDGLGWPFIRAHERLAAEEERNALGDAEPGRDQAWGRAFVRLVAEVARATGVVPLDWPMFYDVAHDGDRHPSAEAERVGRRRPRRGR